MFVSRKLQKLSLKGASDANATVVHQSIGFLLGMLRLMPHQSSFIDESWLSWAKKAFVNLLALIVVHHVLLEMCFVAEDFSAERAWNFIDDVRVSDVIFQHTLGGVVFVAYVTRVNFSDLRVFQFDVSSDVTLTR